MIEIMWRPSATSISVSSEPSRTVKLCGWLIVTLLLIAVCLMTGCASGTPPMVAAPSLNPPASLMVTCKTLPMATSGTLRDLVMNHIEVAQQYYDCADKHNALVDLIEQ